MGVCGYIGKLEFLNDKSKKMLSEQQALNTRWRESKYILGLDSTNTVAGSRPSALDDCLKYFRALGLSDEQIRVAITPALFDLVRAGKEE